jgi:hypothetical protein
LSSTSGFYCVAGLSAPNPCQVGFKCPVPADPPIPCEAGTYCRKGSSAATPCNAGSFSTKEQQASAAACKKCATCNPGTWETTTCSITTNRECTACTGKPGKSSYISVGSECKWVCDGGYHGDNCDPCPADYWCKSGLANSCPENSYSPEGSFDESACACQPGYYAVNTVLSVIKFGDYTKFKPCMKCKAGSICPGSNLIPALVKDQPVEGAAQQVVVAEKSLPPAANLVGLYDSIPSSLQKIKDAAPAGLDVSNMRTGKICRANVCVDCDGTDKCIPQVIVSVTRNKKVGGYAFSVTSVSPDTMYTFQVAVGDLCVPRINIDSDYVSGLRMVIPKNHGLKSIPFVCPGEPGVETKLLISSTPSKGVRRLLEWAGRRLLQLNPGRRLLQMDPGVNLLGVTFIVPTNDTAAVTGSLADVGVTVQGYISVDSADQNTTAPPLSCPENATSPEGSISISQCVCKPGYQGFASAGTPCSPCPPGKFCSGGLIDLCAANALAPPMSDAADDCACVPGFYGHRLACKECPVNHFCSGGTLNATKCPSNAVSPAQSTSSDSCGCVAGYHQANGSSQCTLCPLGSWCWGGIANTCPADSISAVGAKSALDCLCKDGYRLHLTTDVRGVVTRNCLWCSENTYCKVRQTPEFVFNMHPPPSLHG